jgi:ribosomal protein L20
MNKISLTKLEFESLRLARQNSQIIVTEITSQILAQKLRSKGFDLNQLIIIDISDQDPALLQCLTPAQNFIRIEACAKVAEEEGQKLLKHIKNTTSYQAGALTKKMLSEIAINKTKPIETIVSQLDTPDASITLKIPQTTWNIINATRPNHAYQALIAGALLRDSLAGKSTLIQLQNAGHAVALNATSINANSLNKFLILVGIIKKDQPLNVSLLHHNNTDKMEPVTLCIQPLINIQSLLNQTTNEILKSAAGILRLVG